MAYNLDYSEGGHTSTAKPMLSMGGVGWVSKTIDCAVTNITNGYIVNVIHVPAGADVLDFVVDVQTVEGGALTIDAGPFTHSNETAIDADGFIDGLDCNSATGLQRITRGILMSDSDLPTGSKGSWSAQDVASDIAVTFNNAADAAKITFHALVAYPPK